MLLELLSAQPISFSIPWLRACVRVMFRDLRIRAVMMLLSAVPLPVVYVISEDVLLISPVILPYNNPLEGVQTLAHMPLKLTQMVLCWVYEV